MSRTSKWLGLAVVFLTFGCGAVLVGGQASPARVASAPRTSAGPAPTPGACETQPAATNIPPGWVATCSVAGAFSFWHPADWYVKSCDTAFGSPYAVATFVPATSPCNPDEYDQRFSLQSSPGNQPPPAFNSQYYASTGSGTVQADGVTGTRSTYHVLTDAPLPPPKGTDVVLDVFSAGGRTYVIEYSHYPAEADRTVDFDTLVKDTLRFEAP